ncbi:MAG: GGDEF domain-containing protein [Holophagaceae bacterium]|nr:GGDEF domain-containing protein [Holophagaceae bacterium]
MLGTLDHVIGSMVALPAELWEAFGAGVYLVFGVINLDLWFRRRDRLGHLWLAGSSAGALMVDITGMILRRLEPTAPPWVQVFNGIGVAVATVCLFELVCSLGHKQAGRVARILQSFVLILAPIAGLLLPRLLPVLLLGCFVLLGWAMARAFRAAREGGRAPSMVAKGFLVLTVCLILDLMKEFHFAPIPSGLPILGFIVLFLTSTRSLIDRFGREEEASRTDSLTGLLNRRGFLEATDGALTRSRRSRRPVSIVLSDLDHFKRVNDSFGHAACDAVLKAVADAIRSSLRSQDVAARWGGEEFILLLPDTGKEGAMHVAESTRAAVSELVINHDGSRIQVTLSLGVAEHLADRSIEETVAQADAALYKAKEEGRNRVAG